MANVVKKERRELRTFSRDLAEALHRQTLASTTVRWPNAKYCRPGGAVDFFHEVLGIRTWKRQRDLINSLQNNRQTVCYAGRRVSKSVTAAGMALFTFCSYETGQVLLTAPVSDQVKDLLWPWVRRLHSDAGLCVACRAADPNQLRPCPHSALIDGTLGMTPRSGLKSSDPRYPRFIIGRTARRPESLQGFGSPNCLIIADESSGIEDPMWDPLTGALAGGGHIGALGNCNRTTGYFHDLQSNPEWHKLVIQSTETPNCTGDEPAIPGLADPAWIESKRREHGDDSAYMAINVYARFPTREEGRLFSPTRIAEAQARHNQVEALGLLHIGLDPAGPGFGDLTVFALRRGFKFLCLNARQNMDEFEILAELLELLELYGRPNEIPVLNYDSEGPVGRRVGAALQDHLDRHPDAYDLWRIKASKGARREPETYATLRDELAGNLDRFVREGGSLPPDQKLAEELALLEWKTNLKGLAKITPKEVFKKMLRPSRSPDRLDSIQLALWQAPSTPWQAAIEQQPPVRHQSYQQPTSYGSRLGNLVADPYGDRRR